MPDLLSIAGWFPREPGIVSLFRDLGRLMSAVVRFTFAAASVWSHKG